MSDPSLSPLEKKANDATRYPAFGINLLDTRRTVAEMLSEIGKYGFFEQYTKHNIFHIDVSR
jgi:hypothetical protein